MVMVVGELRLLANFTRLTTPSGTMSFASSESTMLSCKLYFLSLLNRLSFYLDLELLLLLGPTRSEYLMTLSTLKIFWTFSETCSSFY